MTTAPFHGPPLANPRADRVRAVARLATRAGRERQGAFLAEGPQAVREALRAHRADLDAGRPGRVLEVFASAEALRRHPDFADPADRIPLREATDEVLAALSDTVTPQGVVAVCRIATQTMESILAARPRLLAVLCRVQDPGNAGTILRAADAAGADAVVATAGSVDLHNPKAVRSTAGSLFHLPLAVGVGLGELAASLRRARVAVLAADGYGDRDLDALQDASAARRLGAPGRAAAAEDDGGAGAAGPALEAPTAWLFGNEAQGLSDAELAAADHRVAVPIYGVAESLNVGTAATVCLYASARAQRRTPGR